MTQEEMQQACLDLSNSAIALFDLVEKKGLSSPLEEVSDTLKLKALFDASTKIVDYYQHCNIQKMMALGVSPSAIFKMGDPND